MNCMESPYLRAVASGLIWRIRRKIGVRSQHIIQRHRQPGFLFAQIKDVIHSRRCIVRADMIQPEQIIVRKDFSIEFD